MLDIDAVDIVTDVDDVEGGGLVNKIWRLPVYA
jgi:hypothetical protein